MKVLNSLASGQLRVLPLAVAVAAVASLWAAAPPAWSSFVPEVPPSEQPGRHMVTLSAPPAPGAAPLASLGMALLRPAEGQAAELANQAASPLSVALALGLVHAGVDGPAARELDGLMAPRVSGDVFWRSELPALVGRLRPGAEGTPWTVANRVWVAEDMAAQLRPGYMTVSRERFAADAAGFDRAQPEAARGQINAWIAEATRGLVPELLSAGSISSDTGSVLTSAIHFKSPWDAPFDLAQTRPRPFTLADGSVVQVPTMADEREVMRSTVQGVQVLALPFKGGSYSVLFALSSADKPLAQVMQSLDGGWVGQALAAQAPQTCRLSLPRFTLPAETRSLKDALQALGIRTAFGDGADFSPMLGAAGRDMQLGDVFHGATVTLDEAGGEAAAATAATVAVKSLRPTTPACAVDRPFAFAIVHEPTGTVLFMGQVVKPEGS